MKYVCNLCGWVYDEEEAKCFYGRELSNRFSSCFIQTHETGACTLRFKMLQSRSQNYLPGEGGC